jgi:glycosyltransferase involved in cell wall biosynthesis
VDGTSPTFSVIVPTIGRRSLAATLASIAEQIEPGDEILVLCNRDDDYGNQARQSLLERARGSHLVFMDDDDQFARGAFATMRRFAREHPGRIGIFRMRFLDGRVLWKEPELRRTNVGSLMYCVPNVPEKLGRWTDSSEVYREQRRGDYGDFVFISETAALQGEPVFRPEVVAHIRSDRRRSVRLLQAAARAPGALLRRLRRPTASRPS